jgi:hypothetical protein
LHRQIDNDRKKYKVNENEFVYDHLTFSSELGDNNLGANCKCTPKLLKNVKYPDLPNDQLLHKVNTASSNPLTAGRVEPTKVNSKHFN